jgi:uncharacterized protein (TIGR03437 family)
VKPISLVLVGLVVGLVAAYAQTPTFTSTGVANSASFAQGQPLVPGSLVSIFGTNLGGSGLAQSSTIPLSSALANTSVTFNGVTAPLLFATQSQINLQVPWEAPSSGNANVVVTYNNNASSPVAVPMGSGAPGIFSLLLDSSGNVIGAGTGQAIAYGNSDGDFAAPPGAIKGFTTHPAKINDQSTLVILATGLGAVNGTVQTGDVPVAITASTVTTPTVLVGGVQAKVVFCGLVGHDSTGVARGYVGVYQLNIIIQPGTPTGNAVPLQIQMNGITSTNQVTIAVSN